jgi:hypothetical protein
VSSPVVRDATDGDAAACAAIYAPYVTDTAITFEYEPPTAADMAARIASAQGAHAWLVLAHGAQVVGYAYAGPHKERARPAGSAGSTARGTTWPGPSGRWDPPAGRANRRPSSGDPGAQVLHR